MLDWLMLRVYFQVSLGVLHISIFAIGKPDLCVYIITSGCAIGYFYLEKFLESDL